MAHHHNDQKIVDKKGENWRIMTEYERRIAMINSVQRKHVEALNTQLSGLRQENESLRKENDEQKRLIEFLRKTLVHVGRTSAAVAGTENAQPQIFSEKESSSSIVTN